VGKCPNSMIFSDKSNYCIDPNNHKITSKKIYDESHDTYKAPSCIEPGKS